MKRQSLGWILNALPLKDFRTSMTARDGPLRILPPDSRNQEDVNVRPRPATRHKKSIDTTRRLDYVFRNWKLFRYAEYNDVQSAVSRKRPEELQTVGRAARILIGFKESETVTLSACAAQLGIAKSMAHRLLTTLAEYDLVAFDPNVKAYRVGPAIFAMARSVTEGPSISELIGPLVREAADLTHETITLCKIQGGKGVCVAFADSPHAMRLTVRNGDEYALNAGAIGKCLLAYQADGFLDELAASGNIRRYTENTIVEPERLRAEIQKIRERGFAFSREEMTPGASSIGVPVIEHDGPVRFCLAASGPALRVDDRKDEIASLLVDIAKRISSLVSPKKSETKIKET